MDVLCCNLCGILVLLVFTIWSIITFSSEAYSNYSVSTSKECTCPSIIGCMPCSQRYLVESYIDSDRSLFVSDFSKHLSREACPCDLCDGLINDIEIFRLLSLYRQLIGEGSHRKLVTTVVFNDHPKLSHFVNKHFCEAVIVEYLPPGVFSDPFELQHLVRRKVFNGVSILGDTNLELPSALSNRSVVEIHFDIKIDTPKIVQVPLHARYPPLDYSSYASITIGKPDLLLRCRRKEDSETAACLWTPIDLGVFNESNAVSWRVPRGNESHTTLVTIFTYASAMVCSFLIACSITLLYPRETKMA